MLIVKLGDLNEHWVNKRKILNDPVYGFITLKYDILLDLIDHPYFQRLRRISQLGLSHLVYPGALHNRFHHAIGATFLMANAIEVIRSKGHDISDEEAQAAHIAILLHDIGHGPFSHALEHSIVNGITHEDISSLMMERLNQEFEGQLSLAIEIFKGDYHKPYLHQLVSSQLDMDRLDYLRRDSFYSGVTEGNIGSERIIKMLNVHDGQLVVEEKGIYSIEKFIVARRLMYWQVYLHKTVLSAEYLLVHILKRAKELASSGTELWGSPSLLQFLKNNFGKADFQNSPELLNVFARLDDFDILSAIKVWQDHEDFVLAQLCNMLIKRKLFRIELQSDSFPEQRKSDILQKIKDKWNLSDKDAGYFFVSDSINNYAYSSAAESIKIQYKNGEIRDAAEASDHFNLSALSKPVKKFFICYPRDL